MASTTEFTEDAEDMPDIITSGEDCDDDPNSIVDEVEDMTIPLAQDFIGPPPLTLDVFLSLQ